MIPKNKKNKEEKEPKQPARQKPNRCDNCDGTGLVSYKKLNQATKKHEQVTAPCVMCEGTGKG